MAVSSATSLCSEIAAGVEIARCYVDRDELGAGPTPPITAFGVSLVSVPTVWPGAASL